MVIQIMFSKVRKTLADLHACRGLGLFSVLLLLVTAQLIARPPAHAQDIPPEVLQRLLEQRAAEQGRAVNTPSPLDQARTADQARAGVSADRTAEEGQLAREHKPSALEQDYARRLLPPGASDEERERALRRPPVRQFGYDLFARVAPPQPMLGRLPDSYVLGIGDDLVIALVGSTNRLITTSIDREGNVLLPDLPPIRAAGLALGEFRKVLREQVGKTLLGTEAYVSVGDLRVVNVTVVGEVGAPGLYHVPSLTDLVGVLGGAGGVAKTGSLRSIRVVSRGGRARTIDLYDFLAGRTVDLRVEDGDRIVVPVIGPTVAVAGDVKRPAIYELKEPTKARVKDVLALAGGPLRARGNVIQRRRLDAQGRDEVARVSPDAPVAASDVYILRPERSLKVGRVALVGHVRQPGEQALQAAPSIRALLQDGEALGERPYLPFAVLETEDPTTRQRIYRPIDLTPILAGTSDIALKDRDRLLVFGMDEINYLASPIVRASVLSLKDAEPRQCTALRLLAQRVRQADNERFANILRSVFVTREDRQVTGAGLKKGEEQSGELAEAAESAADEVLSEEELKKAGRERERCNPFYETHPELLPLALEYGTVAIGAVRRPGLYPFAEPASLRDLVAAAGGLSRSADIGRIEITNLRRPRPGTNGVGLERRYVDLRERPMADIALNTGDIVRFSAREVDAEPGTVLVAGEVRYPGVYTIEKGETLLSVLERAGGLTGEAYAFGAVFTRERVKQEQQEGFRRTARELNNALALAALKRDTRGEALTAAAELARSFATVEAAGRVVIEADPAVLRSHPELDTVLEAGDTIYIPKRPNFVLVMGDVLNPGALQFSPDKTVEDYIDEAGGFQLTADKGRVFVVYPNGVAQPVKLSSWLRESITVPPGTTIVVPKDVDPLKTLDLVRDITQVLSQLAVSAASIAVISRR